MPCRADLDRRSRVGLTPIAWPDRYPLRQRQLQLRLFLDPGDEIRLRHAILDREGLPERGGIRDLPVGDVAGEAATIGQVPNAETLTYHYSGAGPVPAEQAKPGEKEKSKDKKTSIADLFGDKKGKKKDKDWTCSASLKFEDGKLVSVNFAHKDVRSPYEWQAEKDPIKQEAKRKEVMPTCTFSLPRCTR